MKEEYYCPIDPLSSSKYRRRTEYWIESSDNVVYCKTARDRVGFPALRIERGEPIPSDYIRTSEKSRMNTLFESITLVQIIIAIAFAVVFLATLFFLKKKRRCPTYLIRVGSEVMTLSSK